MIRSLQRVLQLVQTQHRLAAVSRAHTQRETCWGRPAKHGSDRQHDWPHLCVRCRQRQQLLLRKQLLIPAQAVMRQLARQRTLASKLADSRASTLPHWSTASRMLPLNMSILALRSVMYAPTLASSTAEAAEISMSD